MNTRNDNLVNLVTLALLMALIFLMGQTPLGLIPLGFCNVTLLVIPVAVGTLFMGLKYGVLLGLTFGATSFVSALLRPSTLVGTLMGASLPMVIVMTFLPRLMVPVVIHFVHKAMAHKLEKTGLAVAAACGSLTNTILYLGLMLIFYMICGIDNTAVLTAIGATAGGAGPLEAVAAALITPPIVLALRKAMHKKTASQGSSSLDPFARWDWSHLHAVSACGVLNGTISERFPLMAETSPISDSIRRHGG